MQRLHGAWALAWVVACLAFAQPALALPSYAEVRAAHRPSDLLLLDRHGTPIQTLRMDASVRRLAWVPLQDMSPALLQAVVLSEDQRFWQHSGVDWLAVAKSSLLYLRAAHSGIRPSDGPAGSWANALNTRTRGASTLTMQLAGLIDADLARPAGGRSVPQKIDQVLTALQLEARWKKSEIVEAYLNSVAFRGELEGINAMSQTLFAKHPSGLDAQESAIAAVLVRAPNAPARRVTERACAVLQLQDRSCQGLEGLVEVSLSRRGAMPLGEQLAPHFARQVLQPDGATAQRSTLDAGLQRVALAALRHQLAELSGRNVEDGAIIVLDNRSGEVLAWVGSSGSLSDAPAVDAVLARRQPGSTLKPLVYALAFERRLITPASLLDDSPAQISTGGALYLPQNYDRSFRGWVSARLALGASLNVPAVRLAKMLGQDAVYERFNAFGLALPESAGFYGHSLALGGAEVTLLALANAYRTLANGGVWSDLSFVPPVASTKLSVNAVSAKTMPAKPGPVNTVPASTLPAKNAPHGVAAAAAVHLVTDILADNNARVSTFGLNSALATRGFAAVKTGTSKDMRDNWCLGYTDRYTIGVWIGNASGQPMHDVSGISGAAPIWRTLVQHLHAGQPSRAPHVPPSVVATEVTFEGVPEPRRRELFVRGTEQSLQRVGTQVGTALGSERSTKISTHPSTQSRFGIHSPVDGSIFALDPDIPPAAQRIRFEGEAGTWMLDGRPLGHGPAINWAPWPGKHTLMLMAADGRALQTVRFEVRGASVLLPRK